MNGGRFADRAVRFRLQQNIDERAALERPLMKPAIEYIEDCQQPSLWVCCAAFDLGLKPAAGPHCFASVEKCDRQIDLGIEVAVKAGLGATRLGEDCIDADLVDPVRAE